LIAAFTARLNVVPFPFVARFDLFRKNQLEAWFFTTHVGLGEFGLRRASALDPTLCVGYIEMPVSEPIS
jgi:hypothetical protein